MDAYKLENLTAVSEAIIVMMMIAEIAAVERGQTLDQCMANSPDAFAAYTRYAEAALRAVKQVVNSKNSCALPN